MVGLDASMRVPVTVDACMSLVVWLMVESSPLIGSSLIVAGTAWVSIALVKGRVALVGIIVLVSTEH
jgi:hypothetical protein